MNLLFVAALIFQEKIPDEPLKKIEQRILEGEGFISPLILPAPVPLQDKEILVLVEGLKSDSIDVRQSARVSLVRQGVKALEVLLRIPTPSDREAALRIEAVLSEIVEVCLRSPWKDHLSAPVTLDLADAPVSAIAEGLSKQGPLRIEIDTRNLPDDFRVDRFQVSKMPFGKALETYLEKTGMTVLREDGDRIRIARPGSLTFTFKQVEVKVVFDMIQRLFGVSIRADEGVRGMFDLACENTPWPRIVDDLADKGGWVAVWTSEKELAIRRKADFEKDAKRKSFPLEHLKVEDPVKGRLSRLVLLIRTLESTMSRGASWGSLHGKVSYDARHRAIVVTDREVVLDRASKLIAEYDRKPE